MSVRSMDAIDPLLRELRWFIRLRWAAGAAVVGGMALNAVWFGSVTMEHTRIAIVGVGILIYNVLLYALHRRSGESLSHGGALVGVALSQIALDLICLMLLNVWTGGVRSPLIGFFVLHMVFASLMLPRLMAYGAACLVVLLMAIGTGITGQWPAGREEVMISLGWLLTLYLTVFLASHVTAGLRDRDKRLQRQQRALIQSEKMSVMGQMAAGVTHELSNPLASMDSLLQLMKRKPDRMTDESVDVLRGQIERMNKTIRMMGTFVHSGDPGAEMAELNVIVERALDMAAFDQRLNGVELVRSYDPACGAGRLAPQTVEQVVVNLVLNAADAVADRPSPRVEVRTKRVDQEYVLSVVDNGPGIPSANHEHVFDPFFTTKPAGRGTGLGLAICSRLIKQHGGTIKFDSTTGKGTSFHVILPVSGGES